jgi:hypothetical protein
MDNFKHINTICNIEFYFEYKNKFYLREQIHGSQDDKYVNSWYEVGKNKTLKVLKNNNLEKILEKEYLNWIKNK